MLRNAIVRPPSVNFAEGLTTRDLGAPHLARALEQHGRYCEALVRCGLSLTRLAPDPQHPDSTFVEDCAVITPQGAILARPGAPSREGEVAGLRRALERFTSSFRAITPPGTLDGGDVCEAGSHVFIGLSKRTNEEGARQLAGLLAEEGIPSTTVDIRGVEDLLHLKSGIAYLGERRLVAIEALAGWEVFRDYEIVRVEPAETYAANCLRVNDQVLLALGFPLLHSRLLRLGYSVVPLDMSEFQKMDGGLSCLSVRLSAKPGTS